MRVDTTVDKIHIALAEVWRVFYPKSDVTVTIEAGRDGVAALYGVSADLDGVATVYGHPLLLTLAGDRAVVTACQRKIVHDDVSGR